MKRTAIYIRVSTQAQAQEGDSIAAQREALTNYIHSHDNLVFAGEYMDDGISGQKFRERDELQRLIADVEAGKIDLVLVTKMDRLHRSLKHFLEMQEIFDRNRVSWLSIWEPMYDTSTPAGQLIINQMMSFAQFEAQNAGQRIRSVLAYKASQGEVISGKIPCGYRIENKHLVPNEVAPSVVQAFEIYAACGSVAQTVDKCYSLPGLPRSRGAIRNLLRNRIYIGEHCGSPDFCPPIVDRGLFEEVQRLLPVGQRNDRKHIYIFSGIIYCGNCGWRYNGISTPIHHVHGDGTAFNYRCPHHYLPPRTCPNTYTIREGSLEDYLLSHLQEEMAGYVLQCKAEAAPARDNTARIAALQKKAERLKELYVNDLITLEEYKTDKERYMNEIAALSAETTPPPVDTSALEELLSQDITVYYSTLSASEKARFWRSILKKIILSHDRTITMVFA